MDWIVNTLREYPALAIFITVGLGFWVGQFKYKSFSLGVVTSVLLVGVLVGQLDIPISGPVKSTFFLMFLFAIGYSVGPQFFASLRGTGLKQAVFALVLCGIALLVTWGVAKAFGYTTGEAVGLFAGAQTSSAIIGVAGDAIGNMQANQATKQEWINIIPVCYAVTYIFGTIGSAWILGNLGPRMLGGLKKVREDTRRLEAELSGSSLSSDPAMTQAAPAVVFRGYVADGDFFTGPRSISDIEANAEQLGRRLFVERVRVGGIIKDNPDKSTIINKGDEIVISGRREYVVKDESWIGTETADAELLSFPVEKARVLLTKKGIGKQITVGELRARKSMTGVMISSITRGGIQLPVLTQTQLQPGDNLQLTGLAVDTDRACKDLGYEEKATNKTDFAFVGLGIFIGGLIGAITIHCGGIPISLSTSGGALIAGLVFGWLRSKHPTFGFIPEPSVWVMNNLGLNVFIAVIGIASGPTFVSGIKAVGPMLFVAGIIATSVPLILGILIGDKIFHFRPAINLGCNAGARTTTAALGAIQDSLGSSVPAMGYTVTYAIGNTLLILMGVALTLMI